MSKKEPGSRPPATTPQAREDQLVAMAYDLVEQRIRDGSATGAELVQILKWGSTKERLEKELMERELELKAAKTEALQSAKKVEELYEKAIDAMKSYGGMHDD